MAAHVCPWWGGYFIDNRWRRLLHRPESILGAYVQPGMTALDFGCGMGFFALSMARLVGENGRVIAVDLQPQMLRVLETRARRAGVAEQIRTHRCARESLGLEGPVDFALAFWSAHEVPNVGRLLREIRACLSDQGQFLVVEPVIHVTGKAFARMMEMANEAGLREQQRPHIALSHAALLVKRAQED
jgi:ubiquinone/menaquinone biosynthesis C-methylase UbiE